MKNLIALTLALTCVLGPVGCGSNHAETVGPGRPITAYIGDDVTTVDIIHHVAGETTQWIAAGEEVDSLRTWASDLEYTLVEFEEGQSPGDRDGGEVYDFVLTEGDDPGFSYIINGADTCYLLIEGHWYSVTNPSNPPIINVQTPEADTVQFHNKTFNKSDLSQETIEWLEWYNGLNETEQLAISSIPSDLHKLYGYPNAEDVKAVETDSEK